MNDSIIRQAIHSRLVRHHHLNPNTLVLDELGIHHGQARIDIAVVNGSLIGFEIKSEKDDLSRLPKQIGAYNTIFKKLTLVVASKFLERAIEIVPKWWGIIEVKKGTRGGIHFNSIRIPNNNPSIRSADVAKLLWKNEVVELLKDAGYTGKILRQKREVLYENLAEIMCTDKLQAAVCQNLKERQNWRDHPQPL